MGTSLYLPIKAFLTDLGLDPKGEVHVCDIVVEPVPWKPRKDGKRRSRIVDEHRRHQDDPTLGGSTKQPIMTAYRQQAARMLVAGPARP